MKKTRIDYVDSSWSPISGCLQGCPYCYSRDIANRFKGCNKAPDGKTDERIIKLVEKQYRTTKTGKTVYAAYPYGFTPTFHEYRLSDLQTGGYGKNIFVCYTSDMFGEYIPDPWIEAVFDACKASEDHRYIFLTKNPKRYIELSNAGKLPSMDNFWYGTTADNPYAKIFWADCYHTFVSIEPILEPFGEPNNNGGLEKIEWAIIGAETGRRKGKVIPERSWIEPTVDWLNGRNIPVFMKDSMRTVWGTDIITEYPWDSGEG